jgi:hypothetical protein
MFRYVIVVDRYYSAMQHINLILIANTNYINGEWNHVYLRSVHNARRPEQPIIRML